MTTCKEIIRCEKLEKSFDTGSVKVEVLKGIDLSVNEQDFVAIMGKSGSGKTTLLKQLAILDRPTSGNIFFKDEDCNKIRGDKLASLRRNEIGFIYQDYYLMETLSVIENIMLPKVLNHCDGSECIEDAKKIAKLMDVENLLDKRICELSGGEKQRTAICRSLIYEPEILFADEPTGNLDTKTSEAVMKYIEKINKEMGKTIIMVTHDAYVASYCNKVIFIKDGLIDSTLEKDCSQEDFFEKIVNSQKFSY